ncbi:MAG: hypothetical protein V3S89_04805 [Desulfobacterales bacterium]
MADTIDHTLQERLQETLGHLMPRLIGSKQILIATLLSILGVVILGIIFGSGVIQRDLVRNSEDGSVRQVKSYLYKTYPGPDGFQVIRWGVVEKNSGGTYKYSVRCKYASSNEYGGYGVHEKIFNFDRKGHIVEVMGF